MNISWAEYPPHLRQRLAEADPVVAADLERWEKSQIVSDDWNLEVYEARVAERMKEYWKEYSERRKRKNRK